MKYSELIRGLRDALTEIYGAGEARAMTRLVFTRLKGWNTADLIIHEGEEVSDYIRGKVADILRRLQAGEPIQYILGEAYFYGMDFKVAPGVLIPRPETEELVDMIVKEERGSDLRVLDVCTGSGCIAIALSRNLLFPRVTAIDVSEEALRIAEENAKALKADIDFIHADIFKWEPDPESFDIIVSNPPYIDESEKSGMDRNVLDYEPALALFVPDSDPLLFYRRIAELGRTALAPGGRIYFEINPRHADDLVSLMESLDYQNIQIVKDIHSRPRFLSASL